MFVLRGRRRHGDRARDRLAGAPRSGATSTTPTSRARSGSSSPSRVYLVAEEAHTSGRARRGRRRALPRPQRAGERLRHPAAGTGGVAGERHDPGVGGVRADRPAADRRWSRGGRHRTRWSYRRGRDRWRRCSRASSGCSRRPTCRGCSSAACGTPDPPPPVAGARGDLLVGHARRRHAGRGVRDPGRPCRGRETLVFLAFFVTVATLLLHGLTLPAVIRQLGVREDGPTGRRCSPRRRPSTPPRRPRIARLDELTADPRRPHPARRREAAPLDPAAAPTALWERLGRPDDGGRGEPGRGLPAAAPGDARPSERDDVRRPPRRRRDRRRDPAPRAAPARLRGGHPGPRRRLTPAPPGIPRRRVATSGPVSRDIRHAESRLSARRVPVPGTVSLESRHGESPRSARRASNPDTATRRIEHGQCGVRHGPRPTGVRRSSHLALRTGSRRLRRRARCGGRRNAQRSRKSASRVVRRRGAPRAGSARSPGAPRMRVRAPRPTVPTPRRCARSRHGSSAPCSCSTGTSAGRATAAANRRPSARSCERSGPPVVLQRAVRHAGYADRRPVARDGRRGSRRSPPTRRRPRHAGSARRARRRRPQRPLGPARHLEAQRVAGRAPGPDRAGRAAPARRTASGCGAPSTARRVHQPRVQRRDRPADQPAPVVPDDVADGSPSARTSPATSPARVHRS